jgi:transglutaminase-like putative cysteine protease
MNQRRQVTFVAAAATLLATAPLATIYATWTWSIDCLFAVGAVCLAALGTRALRAPMWAQVLAMLAALSIMVTWLFGSAGAIAGTIPTGTSLHHFQDLLRMAQADINNYGIPVPDRQGLLFLTTLSVGLVAILVDLVAVGLRRPALAGFPMLAMYWIPVLVHTDSVSFIAFTVGAVGFLWLLVTDNVDRVRRFGRRFTGEGRDVDMWEPSPLAAAGRRLAVVGVVFAIVLPLAIPGMTNGLLDRFGSGTGQGLGPGGNGRGTTVNLFSSLAGELNLTKQHDMVKVTTTDPQPYYLRIGEADRLTESGFSSQPPAAGQSVTETPPNPAIASGVTQKKYQATVTVSDDLSMRLLPIFAQPTKFQKLDSSWLYDPASGLVYSSRSYSAGRQYAFEFLHTDYKPEALREAKPLSTDNPIQRADTEVPSEQVVEDIVAKQIKGKTTDYDKVLALYSFFSSNNGFQYSLSTKSGTSGSDIVDFLTNKQGYCEQYASALAWLVRAAHIPARVAFGFTRGSRQNNTYTMTNYNLHAWTEVYFAGYGWVPFDATPTAGVPGSVSPVWAPDVNHKDAAADPAAVGPTSGPGANNTNDPDKKLPGEDGGDSVGLGAPHAKISMWPWYLVGAIVLVLLLIALPALRRSGIRRGRRPRAATSPAGRALAAGTGSENSPPGRMAVVPDAGWWDAVRLDAHATWSEFVDTLTDYHIAVDDAETPRVTVERLTASMHLSPDASDGIRLIGRAEETARYARTPLFAPGLAGSLRTVRSAISRRAPWRTRLRAVLLPPSVLRRWRAALVGSTNSTASTLGRFGDRTTRMLSPRRLVAGRMGR